MVVVIGAGISGLATATWLKNHGIPVTVVSGHAPGGLVKTDDQDGYRVERGAHGFLDKEPAMGRLVDLVGLKQDEITASSVCKKRFFFARGTLHPLPRNPLGILTFGGLSPRGRLRLLAEPFVSSRAEAEETLAGFTRRRLGHEALRLLGAAVSGIYAGDPEKLAAMAAFPNLVGLETEHGSLFRGALRAGKAAFKSSLRSFRHGMGALSDAMIAGLGDAVLPGLVLSIEKRMGRGGYTVRTDLAAIDADAVVLCVPAYLAAGLVEMHEPALAYALKQIEYVSLAVVALGYRREDVPHALDGYGFLPAREEGVTALGCLFETSLFPDRAPAGQVLLRLMLGGALDPDRCDESDESLVNIARADLARVLGVGARPAFASVRRHRRAIPQYTRGHLALMQSVDAMEARTRGWFLGGNWRGGVGVNDCVRNAENLAARIARMLSLR